MQGLTEGGVPPRTRRALLRQIGAQRPTIASALLPIRLPLLPVLAKRLAVGSGRAPVPPNCLPIVMQRLRVVPVGALAPSDVDPSPARLGQ